MTPGRRIGFHGSSHTAIVVSVGPVWMVIRDEISGRLDTIRASSSYVKKLRGKR